MGGARARGENGDARAGCGSRRDVDDAGTPPWAWGRMYNMRFALLNNPTGMP